MSMGLQEELSPKDQAAAAAAAERAQSHFTELPKTPHKDIRKVDDQKISPVKHEVHIKNPFKKPLQMPSSSNIADVKDKEMKRSISFSEAYAQGQYQGSRPTFGKPPQQEGILKPAIKRELPESKKKVYTDSEDDEKLLEPSSESEDCICPTDHTNQYKPIAFCSILNVNLIS